MKIIECNRLCCCLCLSFLFFLYLLDQRVKDWPLMQNPLPTILICISYVIIVKYLGPYLMKNREPLKIRWLMVFYNFFMVIISLYIFLTLGYHGWFGKYNYKCQPVDYSNSIDATAVSSDL